MNKKRKYSFDDRIIVGGFLIAAVLLSGMLMLVFGIKDTYTLNKKIGNYNTTDGYFESYDIYNSDEDGITYRLTYVYEVDNKKYYVSTDYGTSYIPAENSVREFVYCRRCISDY